MPIVRCLLVGVAACLVIAVVAAYLLTRGGDADEHIALATGAELAHVVAGNPLVAAIDCPTGTTAAGSRNPEWEYDRGKHPAGPGNGWHGLYLVEREGYVLLVGVALRAGRAEADFIQQCRASGGEVRERKRGVRIVVTGTDYRHGDGRSHYLDHVHELEVSASAAHAHDPQPEPDLSGYVPVAAFDALAKRLAKFQCRSNPQALWSDTETTTRIFTTPSWLDIEPRFRKHCCALKWRSTDTFAHCARTTPPPSFSRTTPDPIDGTPPSGTAPQPENLR